MGFRPLKHAALLFAVFSFTLNGPRLFAASRPFENDIALYDRLLAGLKPGQTTVPFGDVGITPAQLREFRQRLVSLQTTESKGAAPEPDVVTPSGTTFKWPSGNVYYRFDPTQVTAGTITTAKMTQFRDGVAEWAAFANLHFIEFTGTPPTSYITVQQNTTGGEGGYSSSVGMHGGEQLIQLGNGSWNRGTICHEMGHALGLWHEQQRPDRDTYVVLHPENYISGTDANWAIVPDGQLFGTAYDFYSVMHYSRNALSSNGQDTMTMKPGSTQYLNVIGQVYDRTLSKIERAGMATIYGNPTILPSALVTSTNDSGPGSLRTAIYYAFDRSTDAVPTPTTITFHIPTSDPGYNAGTGIFTIKPTNQLTALGNGTTIDGTSQTSFTGNTNPNGPEITIDGSNFAVLGLDPFYLFSPGITIRAANCTIKGLAIVNFDQWGVYLFQGTDPNGSASTGNVIGSLVAGAGNVISGNSAHGVALAGATTTGNIVEGNYIGTNQTATAAQPNGNAGVAIYSGAHGNTIGGTTAAARNVISGNSNQGILLADAGTNNNFVQGNYIGLDATGAVAVPNAYSGVDLFGGAQSNTIGGTSAGARNIIAGNLSDGVSISEYNDVMSIGTRNNLIQGNYVGLNAAGNTGVPNHGDGVDIYGGAPSNTVGGTAAGAGNLISGNTYTGVAISGAGTNNTLVQGNVIGLNAAGNGKIQNSRDGVAIFGGAQSNTIGGTSAAARNIISGNQNSGVSIGTLNTNNNLVQGNYIGIDATGATARGNGGDGVAIYGDNPAASPSPAPAPNTGAKFNTIGGTTAAALNVISGNGGAGVSIGNAGNTGTNQNLVQGNYIGVDVTGTLAKANSGAGVSLYGGAQSNTIGGTSAAARNIISGNSAAGVSIGGLGFATGTTNGPKQNTISGNYIGVDVSGANALGNGAEGVSLFQTAQSNVIGGSSPGARNIISANNTRGIGFYDSTTTGNLVLGNYIGLNAAGAAAFGNSYSGIEFYLASNNTVGGIGGGLRNFISGNHDRGVLMDGPATTGNIVEGNTIGLDVNGTARANTSSGVEFFGGAHGNTIGGATPGASNQIASNGGDGIRVYDSGQDGTNKNALLSNSIFSNSGLGIDLLYGNNGALHPNNAQPHPTLTTAVLGVGTTVNGSLSGSVASALYRIEFFATPSGTNSGKNFIGAQSLMTNGSGAATISLTLSVTVSAGSVVTATATDPNGNTSDFSNAIAVTTTDSDGDGIPDAWMNLHFGHPTGQALDKSRATDDADGDGLTNLQEFLAGTDPNISTSKFRVTAIAPSGSDVALSFGSVIGKTYRIESKDDVTLANWTLLEDQVLATGSSTAISDFGALGLTKRFYRVSIEP